jgi:cytochrome P450
MREAPSLTFNQLEPPHAEDPYPLYERLREQGAVVFNPAFDMWFVTRYEEAQAVLKDPQRFSSAEVLRLPSEMPPEVLEVLRDVPTGVYPLLSSDPPSHTRVRELVGKGFTSQRISALEPRIRSIATELADGFAGSGRADVVSRFAIPLPQRVMSEMFGVAAGDVDAIKRWCDDETLFMMAPLSLERQVECARSVAAYRRYLYALVEEHRGAPKGNLVNDLLDARLAGDVPLSTDEIAGALCVLIFAGHETTTNMLGNALLHLLRRPGMWQALRDEPGLIPGALEEALRYDSAVQGMTRTTTEPVELSGVTLPKGARVFVLFASANRDSVWTSDPDRFDIQRANPSQHLSFGRGIHFCIGAQLARLEGRIALEVLSRRLPNAHLLSEKPPAYLPNLVHRGPRALEVAWDT